MRIVRKLALGASMLTLAFVGTAGVGAQSPAGPNPPVRIGSDAFFESEVVAEAYAQALEAAGYQVDRNLALGFRPDRAPAFEQGQVDLVPEYVGSGLANYDATKVSADGEANRAALQAVFDAKDHLATVLAISPGQDVNAFVVRADTAAEYHLASMNDLAAVQDKLTWGLPPECGSPSQLLCHGALEAYGITFPPANLTPLAACSSLMAEALNGGGIDVAELCSTQPAIAVFGFVQLTDDKGIQPADNLVPLVRNDYLARLSDPAGFKAVLDGVSALLTSAALTNMGVDDGFNHRDTADIAHDLLAGAYQGTPPAVASSSPAVSPAG